MNERDDRAALLVEMAALRAEQRRLFERIAANTRHFRGLARSVFRVQEDERRRFARDLHDGIGQNLTALKHRLQLLQNGIADRSEHPGQLAAALQLCTDTLEDTRSLSRMLRPQILDDLGLEAALRWLARSSSEAARFTVEVEIDALPETLDADVATLVFRVAQEGFANIVRHAGATQILLRVHGSASHLHMLLVDDGVGCELAATTAPAGATRGSGISGMRERAELFGAQFKWISAPSEGTQIRLLVPLTTSAGAEGA